MFGRGVPLGATYSRKVLVVVVRMAFVISSEVQRHRYLDLDCLVIASISDSHGA